MFKALGIEDSLLRSDDINVALVAFQANHHLQPIQAVVTGMGSPDDLK